MLRITTTTEAESRLRICIEGSLTRRSVGQLRDLDGLPGTSPLRVHLDLSQLRFADEVGAAALRDLAAKGAVLSGASPYVVELLRSTEEPAQPTAIHPTQEETMEPAPTPMPTEDPEQGLLERLRRRDAEAYAEIVHSLGGRLLATARRLLRDEEEARDVVQEAFLSAFKSIDSFSGGSKLSTWLHSIATNAALMRLRSRRRRPEASIDDLLPRFDETGHWQDSPPVWNAPAEALEGRQLRAAVRRCIDRLPETHRTILLLRDVEDLSTAEAARALGITETAVKLRLHRARLALRALLQRDPAIA